jgi:hypothetical protein
MAEERRRFTRVDLNSKVVVSAQGANVDGDIRDLSLSGVYVIAPGKVPLDEAVKLEMVLAGPTSELILDIQGVVVRHGDDGFGIRFDLQEFELDTFLHLRNVIAYLNEPSPDTIMDEFMRMLAEQAQEESLGS